MATHLGMLQDSHKKISAIHNNFFFSSRYHTLSNNNCCSLKNFRMSMTGRLTTHYLLGALETVSVVPKGTSKVSSMLEVAAKSLIESGRLDIFSPMFRCLIRKPVE